MTRLEKRLIELSSTGTVRICVSACFKNGFQITGFDGDLSSKPFDLRGKNLEKLVDEGLALVAKQRSQTTQ